MKNKKTNIEQEFPPTAVPVVPPPEASAAAPAALDAGPAAVKDNPCLCPPSDPPVNLCAPLRWKTATTREQRMLRNLQGNILKGHGRDNTWNVFFRFGADVRTSKRLLRELGNFHVTDAAKQLQETEAFKTTQTAGGTFCSVFLTSPGYKALELDFASVPDNGVFETGMRDGNNVAAVNDPAPDSWEEPFKQEIHGLILMADDDIPRGEAAARQVEEMVTASGGTLIHTQAGKALRNSAGNGLEHFGYIDGRSQPLLLMEDIEKESRDEGVSHWDPAFPLQTVLVRDPLVALPGPSPDDRSCNPEDPEAYGSFFIFRKLEQKVAAFKLREQELADHLGLAGEARELAGALVVGRFEDGTPVTMADEAKGIKNPPNDFNYSADSGASRCPFHAHIRKTNPRGSGGAEPEKPAERAHIMARRGIPYEDKPRGVHPDKLPESSSKEEFLEKVFPLLPVDGLGLLFMAYNSKLEKQFVFTQKFWANSVNFPRKPTPGPSGIDGVIGQEPPAAAGPAPLSGQTYPLVWDDPAAGAKQDFDFKGFVTMKGGEYFFAPSVLFLRSL